ncbi:cation:proton antiporter [Aquihabitans sp. McL0605]|uniref:cation:proton antiporter n=1 Tax=Aquihabitans sp. McL0605 TaxID=3415671 RepID=UPI003CF3A745
MNVGLLVAVGALVFFWSVVAGRVERLDVTGPIVFVLAGMVLGNGPLRTVDISVGTTTMHVVAEVTLVLVLFADASRVNLDDLRRSSGLPIRLLAIGLPLTFALGFALAAVVFTDLPWELAALLGAVLAPTDAALSAAIVSDESLPQGIRRAINVESGLNDGIATPAVTTFIASAAVAIGAGALHDTASAAGTAAVVDIVGGAAIGAAIGFGGGRVIVAARARGWIVPGGRQVAVLMLAALSFGVSRELDVNYFVAAFVAGMAFRAASGVDDAEATELPELLGRVLSLAVWFVFGAALVVDELKLVDWRIAVYAVLSLTVVRMVPVAISMIGSGTGRPATLFIGWFGPRGLASVVFGLLIVEELPTADPGVQTILAVISLTVLLSVLAHGLSGRPLSQWMARQSAGPPAHAEGGPIRPTAPFGRHHHRQDHHRHP